MIDKYSFDFNYPGIFWIGFVILAIYISTYLYKEYKGRYKYFLIGSRTLFIILVSFLIFKPVLYVNRVKSIDKKNILLIDNSESMKKIDLSLPNIKSYDKVFLFGDSLREYKEGDSLYVDKRSNLEYSLFDTSITNRLLKGYISNIDIITDGYYTNSNQIPPIYEKVKLNFLFPPFDKSFDLYIKELYTSYEKGVKHLNIIPSTDKGISYIDIKILDRKNEIDRIRFNKDLEWIKIDISKYNLPELGIEIGSNLEDSNSSNNIRYIGVNRDFKSKSIGLIYKNNSLDIKFLKRFLLNNNFSVDKVNEKNIDNFDLIIQFGNSKLKNLGNNPYMYISDKEGDRKVVMKRSEDPFGDFIFRDDDKNFELSNLPDIGFDSYLKPEDISLIDGFYGESRYTLVSSNRKLTRVKFAITDLYKLFFTSKAFGDDFRFETVFLNILNVMTDSKRGENIKIDPQKSNFITDEDIQFKGIIIDENNRLAKQLNTVVEFYNKKKLYLDYKDGVYFGKISFASGGEKRYNINSYDKDKLIYTKEGSIYIEDYNPEKFTNGVDKSLTSMLIGIDTLKSVIDIKDEKYFDKYKNFDETISVDESYSISLFRNIYIFILIISVLSIEWIIRKFLDMK